MYCTAVTGTYDYTQRMCQVVVNMQLAAGGHYHDVKYPKCVYVQVNTQRGEGDLHHRGPQARGSIETELRCVTDLYHGESPRAETNIDQSVHYCVLNNNFCAYINKRRFDTDNGGQIGCAPFIVRREPIRLFSVLWLCVRATIFPTHLI